MSSPAKVPHIESRTPFTAEYSAFFQQAATTPSMSKPVHESVQEATPTRPARLAPAFNSDATPRPLQKQTIPQLPVTPIRTRDILTPTHSTESLISPTRSQPVLHHTLPDRSTDHAVKEPPPPPQDLTALTSVVLPALESALARRTAALNTILSSQPSSSTSSSLSSSPTKQLPLTTLTTDPLSGIQTQEDLRAAHAHVQRLVARVGRLFREIDEWDVRAPVSMLDERERMGDVGGFLEGFLEEVLVRVEADDG